jgi:hypothetical protein
MDVASEHILDGAGTHKRPKNENAVQEYRGLIVIGLGNFSTTSKEYASSPPRDILETPVAKDKFVRPLWIETILIRFANIDTSI